MEMEQEVENVANVANHTEHENKTNGWKPRMCIETAKSQKINKIRYKRSFLQIFVECMNLFSCFIQVVSLNITDKLCRTANEIVREAERDDVDVETGLREE